MIVQAIESFGSPEVFKTIDIPRPKVIPGHVLIRVVASSVNPMDFKIRSGAGAAISPAFPAVLNADVAGVIEEVGNGVAAFKPGDQVYACAGGVTGTPGALAEYMLADAAFVATKPKSLSIAEAAVLPLVSITAWEALIDRAKLQPGQRILIHGATGGVGHIAIQLAKWQGATVYATASSEEKMAIARDLGADVAINYRTQSVEDYVAEHTNGKGFDVVFDTVGDSHLNNSFQAAALNGTVVTTTSISTNDLSTAHMKGLTLHIVFMLIPLLHGVGRAAHGAILEKIANLVDSGIVRPLIDSQKFSFAEVAAAHRHAESGQAIGKISLIRD